MASEPKNLPPLPEPRDLMPERLSIASHFVVGESRSAPGMFYIRKGVTRTEPFTEIERAIIMSRLEQAGWMTYAGPDTIIVYQPGWDGVAGGRKSVEDIVASAYRSKALQRSGLLATDRPPTILEKPDGNYYSYDVYAVPCTIYGGDILVMELAGAWRPPSEYQSEVMAAIRALVAAQMGPEDHGSADMSPDYLHVAGPFGVARLPLVAWAILHLFEQRLSKMNTSPSKVFVPRFTFEAPNP